MTIILGIDPGTATTGFGIVQHIQGNTHHVTHGVIQTAPSKSASARLLEIREDLQHILSKYKPDICNIEKLFFYNNVTTAMSVAESRGVILMTLEEYGIPYYELTPLQLKVNLTGDGKADKKQIQKMVTVILNLKSYPKPDDAADGLGLALYPSHRIHPEYALNNQFT